jgi:hypothetical protein
VAVPRVIAAAPHGALVVRCVVGIHDHARATAISASSLTFLNGVR